MELNFANEARQGTPKGQGNDRLRARPHISWEEFFPIEVSESGIAFSDLYSRGMCYCRGIWEPLRVLEWFKELRRVKINIILPHCGNAPLLGSELFLLQQRIRTTTEALQQISDLEALIIEFHTSTSVSGEAIDGRCICGNLSPTLGDLTVILEPMRRLRKIPQVYIPLSRFSYALRAFEARFAAILKSDAPLSKAFQTENEWKGFVDQHRNQMSFCRTNTRTWDPTAPYKRWDSMLRLSISKE